MSAFRNLLMKLSPRNWTRRGGHDHEDEGHGDEGHGHGHGHGGGHGHGHGHGGEHASLLHEYPESKTLTRRQVNKALMDMQDTSPLKEMVSIDHIQPCLKCIPCFRGRGSGFRFALRHCINEELGVKIPESEHAFLDEPFLLAGYGVNAYFNILQALSKMFLCITIFCIPLYYTYGRNVGLKGWKSWPVMRFTMGNLGGSSMFCKSSSQARGIMRLRCPPNSLLDIKGDVHMGLMSKEFDSFNLCH